MTLNSEYTGACPGVFFVVAVFGDKVFDNNETLCDIVEKLFDLCFVSWQKKTKQNKQHNPDKILGISRVVRVSFVC